MRLNINEDVWNVIKILMEDSFWGRNSSKVSLIKDLNNEVEEFIQGCKNNDAANSLEEAADVMMILFCILYKISEEDGEITIDKIMKAIIDKLQRRYRHLYCEGIELEESQEKEIWKNVKQIENVTNYMLCNNIKCKFCGKIGEGNIKNENEQFICSGCGSQIKVSKKTVLFYNKKNRKKYIQVVIDSILDYIQGNSEAPEILKTDNLKIFNSFCDDILNSIYNLKDYFVNYVSEKYKLQKREVAQFCDIALEKYDGNIDQLSVYCATISEGNYHFFNNLTNEEKQKMKDRLSGITMDVEKRIEKVIKYQARNWNNQLVHRYLLKYRKDGVDRIIECMTIVHYQDETIRDLTVELSNMYNCVVGCRFCASGALPETTCFLEALDYVRQLNTCLKESGINPNEFENFYVSFAGIGEPSVVHKAIAEGMVMIKDLYPKVKFNIATFGFDNECFDYWSGLDLPIRTLQIPFYSDQVEKLEFVVKNLPQNYQFETILMKATNYKKKWPDCRVKVNYIAMKGINDADSDIKRMCECLEKFKEQIVVKISYLNYTKPGEENNIFSPGSERLCEIKKYLDMQGFECYIFGTAFNTELGCGQLAQNHILFKNA